jgi:hypothetical protein
MRTLGVASFVIINTPVNYATCLLGAVVPISLLLNIIGAPIPSGFWLYYAAPCPSVGGQCLVLFVSVDLGSCMAAYFGDEVGSGQRSCWPPTGEPVRRDATASF